jgi:environmental stress-induced protein Ves
MTASLFTWQMRPLAQAVPSPWRNGGGITHELVAWPDAAAWRWRISVAEVAQDGPFSNFPGVDRHFAVLSGAGVCLTFPEKSVELTAQDPPLAFSGESPCDCRLLCGPTLDFNLMSQGLNAMLVRCQLGVHFFDVQVSDILGFYALEPLQIVSKHAMLEVPAQTLCWHVATQPLRIQVTGPSFLAWGLSSSPER